MLMLKIATHYPDTAHFHYHTVLVKCLKLEEFPRLMNCCVNKYIILLRE